MASLDRLVMLVVDQGGRRTRGEYSPDNVTLTVWARRSDTRADRLLETGGARGQTRRTYRIRYDARVIQAFEAGRELRLTDPDAELSTTFVTVAEPEGTRRRWLDVTVEGST